MVLIWIRQIMIVITPLILASENGHEDSVEYLIE